MRRFYPEVVGLELMQWSDRACFFRLAPGRLVVAGDSAGGGDLVLGLALSLRDSQAPLPSLAICLAPWTDVANSGASMTGNEKYDWVERRMVMKGAQWLCHGADPRSPWISPIRADLGDYHPSTSGWAMSPTSVRFEGASWGTGHLPVV